MLFENTKLLVCNCNKSMPVSGRMLAGALGLDQPLGVSEQLCRRQIGSFSTALEGSDDLIVACTQEAPLFAELHEEAGREKRLTFVNIRESAGWSLDAAPATTKIAALLAAAALPDPEPVGTVSYRSEGRVLIVGEAGAALSWADRLVEQFDVAVVLTGRATGTPLPIDHRFAVHSGRMLALAGWRGAFTALWEQVNPIDLELCTRCNACIAACPEQAIDFSYQIDLDRCASHRSCVTACGEVRAINFDRVDGLRSDDFDLVLDLTPEPLFDVPDPPQGYFAPGTDPFEQALAVNRLAQLVGEFEKPKFFVYKDRICAHARSGIEGCSRCVDVCSTGAIRPDGDHVRVEPHLCMGCGGCATVCPSGAMTYGYQRVADRGAQLKVLLQTYQRAGGRDACILFHGASGRELIARLARSGAGLPAHVTPVESFHIASTGIDLLLGAFAHGACQIVVLSTGREPAAYAEALRSQMGFAEQILAGLGFEGTHFHFVTASDERTLEDAVWAMAPADGVKPATFNLSNDKRATLDFIFDHLAKHSPTRTDAVPLTSGAPFGRVEVNREACTLCMSCVGACPANALADSKEFPRLSFVERNCVQCGLCAKTCPESAITLETRLLVTKDAKQPVMLHEAEPFECIRCGKPFATKQMIDNMTGRLARHSMFEEAAALNRLRMCADCRVVDMVKEQRQISIFDT
jgi:ferredoxin